MCSGFGPESHGPRLVLGRLIALPWTRRTVTTTTWVPRFTVPYRLNTVIWEHTPVGQVHVQWSFVGACVRAFVKGHPDFLFDKNHPLGPLLCSCQLPFSHQRP